ncbi:MAG: hypothetical protein AAGB29_02445 [Planctomycetota bacterium]
MTRLPISARPGLTARPRRRRFNRTDDAGVQTPGMDLEHLNQGSELGPVKVFLKQLDLNQLMARRDGPGDRKAFEGTVEVRIGDQTTLLHWRKKQNDPVRLIDRDEKRLVFAGEHGGLLPVSVRIVESDAEDEKFLKDLSAFLQAGGTLAGLVPAYGTAASAALGLASNLAAYAASRVQDDLELYYVGSIEGAPATGLPTGEFSLVRERHVAEGISKDIEACFEVVGMPDSTQPNKDNEVVLVVDKVDIQPSKLKLEASDKLTFEVKAGADAKQEPFRYEVEGVGSEKLSKFVGLEGAVVYRGPWAGALGVAASLSAVPSKDASGDGESPLVSVVESAGALVKALQPELADEVELAKKVAQPISEMVAAVTPTTKFTLGGTQLFEETKSASLKLTGLDAPPVGVELRLFDTGKKWKKPGTKAPVSSGSTSASGSGGGSG